MPACLLITSQGTKAMLTCSVHHPSTAKIHVPLMPSSDMALSDMPTEQHSADEAHRLTPSQVQHDPRGEDVSTHLRSSPQQRSAGRCLTGCRRPDSEHLPKPELFQSE
eukprot:gnl/TRDRNA2_/TRDRNA2_75020_c0_seq1.p1 gnl/TRDRNA2_/TRDRNA2_75020_c0~~gnl/TRDRNA2_/TRDRNA2_75020_c0_seq1.p1  ORF type:complete len:108 (+),score=12.08 gnl/TRDRNA2_/TRDRNA2_75020_c0_seq1:90-413(+)